MDGLEFSVDNKIKYDGDYDQTLDMKASYRFQLG